MPSIPPTTAIDMDAGQSPCCDADLELSSPPNIYECRECMRKYDTAKERSESESESDTESDVETCQATTADGDPCQNSAGPDGYCHLSSHGLGE
jgi:hypothetical protein